VSINSVAEALLVFLESLREPIIPSRSAVGNVKLGVPDPNPDPHQNVMDLEHWTDAYFGAYGIHLIK